MTKSIIINFGHAQVVYAGYHPVYSLICFQETSDGRSFEGHHHTFELFHCSEDGEPDSPLDIDIEFLRSLPLPKPDTRFVRSFLRYIIRETSEAGEL